MKITKLVHSCLLAETGGKRILVDPGNFSWNSGLVTEGHLDEIDSVVVTHVHPDHCDESFAAAILKHSPDAQWYGTEQVAEKLEGLGIEVNTQSVDSAVQFIQSDHADLSPWMPQQPQHTSFKLFDDLLISGDCHTLASGHGAVILAGAITAPWGGIVGFSKMIEEMDEKPQVVLPLHDWHQNEAARSDLYAKLPDFLAQFDVTFVPLENGKSHEIQLK